MKNVIWLCVVVLCTPLMTSSALGVEYGTDFLETGNPGGWSGSLKTFDEEWTVRRGGMVDVDIWINDLPEELITAGFQIEYDASLVSVSGCDVYDGSLPGPWDGDMTTVVANPSGSNMCVVIVGNLGCVAPDAGDGIPLARITFEGTSPGDAAVTFSPLDGFDMVVGNSSTVYDASIIPHTIVLSVSESGECITEAIYGEHAEQTELLRSFRDRILSRTKEGQQLIALYYKWSPAIVRLIGTDEHFKKDVTEIMDAVLPMIKRIVH